MPSSAVSGIEPARQLLLRVSSASRNAARGSACSSTLLVETVIAQARPDRPDEVDFNRASTNGGATWTETHYLKGAAGEAYFEPSVAITKSGKTAVSFYKANAYGNTDGRGTYGYYLASGATLGALQLVSNSATNLSPQLNPSQAGFLGDYSSIAASTAAGSSVVYPNWSDTRNLSASGQPDEDVFIAKVTLP